MYMPRCCLGMGGIEPCGNCGMPCCMGGIEYCCCVCCGGGCMGGNTGGGGGGAEGAGTSTTWKKLASSAMLPRRFQVSPLLEISSSRVTLRSTIHFCSVVSSLN